MQNKLNFDPYLRDGDISQIILFLSLVASCIWAFFNGGVITTFPILFIISILLMIKLSKNFHEKITHSLGAWGYRVLYSAIISISLFSFFTIDDPRFICFSGCGTVYSTAGSLVTWTSLDFNFFAGLDIALFILSCTLSALLLLSAGDYKRSLKNIIK